MKKREKKLIFHYTRHQSIVLDIDSQHHKKCNLHHQAPILKRTFMNILSKTKQLIIYIWH